MKPKREETSTLKQILGYVRNLPEQTPYWRLQAFGWGIFLVVLVFGGVLFAVLGLSGVYGGGNISYGAVGSPGPVTFRHYTHMTFQDGKYKDCKFCHDRLFASQRYGTYVMRALKDSPEKKVHIGRDASTLYFPVAGAEDESLLTTYEVPRACATCATGDCHNGKESFSRLDCLMCHRSR